MTAPRSLGAPGAAALPAASPPPALAPNEDPAAARDAGGPPAGGHQSAREIIDSPEFKALVARRWAVSFALLALLFVSYYGYIVLIAEGRAFVSRKIGEYTTLAIPLGVAAIVVAWALTAAYVAWANRAYDPEVERLKRRLRRDPPPGGGPTP